LKNVFFLGTDCGRAVENSFLLMRERLAGGFRSSSLARLQLRRGLRHP